DRAAFDARLADEAVAAGARVVRDARVTSISREGGWLVVGVLGHPARLPRACVRACGGRYVLQRQLGFDVPSLLLHTAQREVPVDRPGDVEVHFGSVVAPRGFAWVVPVWREGAPFARIGVMADDRAPTFFTGMVARIA